MSFVESVRTAITTGLGIAVGELFGKSGLHGATFARNVPKIQKEGARVARTHGASVQEAEEVGHSAVFHLWELLEKNPHALDGQRPGPLVRAISVNRFMDRLEKSHRSENELENGWRMLASIREWSNADASLDVGEVKKFEQLGLDQLTAEQRAVIGLEDADLTDREKAKVLRTSVTTMKRRREQAYAILRRVFTVAGYRPPRENATAASNRARAATAKAKDASGNGGAGSGSAGEARDE